LASLSSSALTSFDSPLASANASDMIVKMYRDWICIVLFYGNGETKFRKRETFFRFPALQKLSSPQRCGLISITITGHLHEWIQDAFRSRLPRHPAVAYISFSLDRSAYAGCTKIYRGSSFRRRLDGCRLDLPPRHQCLPSTWGSISRSLSAIHCSPTITESLGPRCHDFSTWLDRDCTCSTSYSRPWIRFALCRATQEVMGCCFMVLCAMAGAVFAAFALSRQRASGARQAFPSFLAALLIGVGTTATITIAGHHSIGFPLPKLTYLVKQFLLYFTVCFAVEEVVFRGALDSHVYQSRSDGQASGSPWLSAIFVSALWGIWHLPTAPILSASAFAAVIPFVIIVHTLSGVPLSFCWRASGTLVLPAAAHALVDAYRNTVS